MRHVAVAAPHCQVETAAPSSNQRFVEAATPRHGVEATAPSSNRGFVEAAAPLIRVEAATPSSNPRFVEATAPLLKCLVENIVCKVYQKNTKNHINDLFHNLLVPGQNLYTVEQNHVHVRNSRVGTNGYLTCLFPPKTRCCHKALEMHYILTF